MNNESEYDRGITWDQAEKWIRAQPNWKVIKWCLAMATHSWEDMHVEPIEQRLLRKGHSAEKADRRAESYAHGLMAVEVIILLLLISGLVWWLRG